MREIRFTPAADDDLSAIAQYTIEKFGKRQASIYRQGLFGAFDLIRQYPMIGSDQSATKEATRRFVHESHSIYYKVKESEILILRILGPGQDPTRHLR